MSRVADALRAAGISFSGGTWLRLKGPGLDSISVNAESGGWRDHRTGEHGRFSALAEKLNFNVDGVVYTSSSSGDWQEKAAVKSENSKKFAREIWERGMSAVRPERAHGWSQAAWNKEQDKYNDQRDAIFDYLTSRGLDPLPLLPLIRFSTVFNPKSDVDNEMLDQGADFLFMIPMFEIGKHQIADNICGIQRTYLKFSEDDYHQTAKIGRAMLGRKGVTEIIPHKNPITLPTEKRVIGSGEGFETVVSFVQSSGHGAIVCWDYSGIRNWTKKINSLKNAPLVAFLVDSDTSETGQRESAAAVHRINAQEHGKAVYLLPPDGIVPDAKGNRDWNDLLKQSNCSDFAAEIVKSWHKSDENLALAPEPLPESSYRKHNEPSDAENAQVIAEAVELHFAYEEMKKGVAQYAEDFANHSTLLKKWQSLTPDERKKQHIKKPKLPPLLIKVTTGVGKSHLIRELVQNTNLPLLILTRTHDLSEVYAEVGAFPYHGRSMPEYGMPEKMTMAYYDTHFSEFKEHDCFKYPIIDIVSENNHVPALTACRNCEHGRKFILENYDNKSEPYKDAINFFNRYNIDKKTIPACLWLEHQMEASHKRIVVAPNASFSDSLATWQTPEHAIPRLVIVDEMPELTRQIMAHSGNLGQNVENAQKSIEYLEKNREANDNLKGIIAAFSKIDTDAVIADIQKAIEVFRKVSAFLGESSGKGIQKIPDENVNEIKKLHVDWLPGATARWEKAEIRYGHEPFIPLRMMKALIESITTNTAITENGMLHIQELSALAEHISKGKSCILLDATPTRAVEMLVAKKEGKIIAAIGKQHINLVHFNQYLHGRSWKNKDHKKSEMLKLLAIREQMTAETCNIQNVLTYMDLCDLADKTNAPDWGYFGRDDIGQDRWKGQDLLIFGGPLFGPLTQAIAYNSELMLMRLAGVENLSDWSNEIEYNQAITVGNKVIESRAPLPVDPALREWVLNDYGRRVAQAIGRVRGVRADASAPINVWIAGGLPLAGLAAHGITVDEYRREKLINLRDQSHKAAVEKVQVAMAALEAADQDPSYRAINKWLADHGLPHVRYDAWKSISKASTGPNKDIYEPVDNLLAALDYIESSANLSGVDVSDVANRLWNSSHTSKRLRIASEIILQASPHADAWRQNQPDDG